jgi:hypothetical protein
LHIRDELLQPKPPTTENVCHIEDELQEEEKDEEDTVSTRSRVSSISSIR